MIVNRLTQGFMFIVFYVKALPLSNNDKLYYDNLMIAAFAVGTTCLGSFLAIMYKLVCHLKNLVIRMFPYFKFYCIKSYKATKSLILYLKN